MLSLGTRHPYGRFLAERGVTAAAYVPVRSGDTLIGLLITGSSADRATLVLSVALPGLIAAAESAAVLIAPTLIGRTETAEAVERMRSMIARRGMRIVYQPVVELASGVVRGFEALSRFDDGRRPDLVFAEARRLGLEEELELATLGMAIDGAMLLPADAFLGLNVSPGVVLGTRLGSLLRARTRPVLLEITEHATIEDYAGLRAALEGLGPDIRVAVDDAGAGIANFGHLVELRAQYVKLDVSLIRGVNSDPTRQAMVVAILHFASATNCKVIAEGIETEAERTVLEHLGVELGQGYLLAMPAEPGTYGRMIPGARSATMVMGAGHEAVRTPR